MKHLPRLLLVIASGSLAACATPKPEVVTAYKVVPVECKEKIPDRPAMPTEALPSDSKVDPYVAAAAAEIKLREGYEGKLRTALEACTKPIHSPEQ